MSLVQFQCPSCQAPLRLENRALFIGRTFPCPDCGDSLLLEGAGSNGVQARSVPADSAKPAPTNRRHSQPPREPMTAPKSSSQLPGHIEPNRSLGQRLTQQPEIIGWCAAALFAIVITVFVTSRPTTSNSQKADPEAPNQETGNFPKATTSLKANDHPELGKPDLSKQSVPETTAPHAEPNLSPEEISDIAKPDEKPSDNSALPIVGKATIGDETQTPKSSENDRALSPSEPKPDEPVPSQESLADGQLSDQQIELRMNQRLARFDQSKPVPFIKLLDVLEDLSGVLIVWDLESVEEDQLQKPVSFQLKQTTVGAVFDEATRQVGLERHLVRGRIELRRPKPAAKRSLPNPPDEPSDTDRK